MDRQKKQVSKSDLVRTADEIIHTASVLCASRGLPPEAVLTVILAAAGTYGDRLKNPKTMYNAIRSFLRTTQQVYPDLVFDPGPYMTYWRTVMEHGAYQEKQFSTVH